MHDFPSYCTVDSCGSHSRTVRRRSPHWCSCSTVPAVFPTLPVVGPLPALDLSASGVTLTSTPSSILRLKRAVTTLSVKRGRGGGEGENAAFRQHIRLLHNTYICTVTTDPRLVLLVLSMPASLLGPLLAVLIVPVLRGVPVTQVFHGGGSGIIHDETQLLLATPDHLQGQRRRHGECNLDIARHSRSVGIEYPRVVRRPLALDHTNANLRPR